MGEGSSADCYQAESLVGRDLPSLEAGWPQCGGLGNLLPCPQALLSASGEAKVCRQLVLAGVTNCPGGLSHLPGGLGSWASLQLPYPSFFSSFCHPVWSSLAFEWEAGRLGPPSLLFPPPPYPRWVRLCLPAWAVQELPRWGVRRGLSHF